MKLISWNVNGLRACAKKGFYDFFKSVNADIFCIQETKMQESQLTEEMKKLEKYEYWNSAVRRGYSGTAIFTKQEPISIKINVDDNEFKILCESDEGRIITAEYEKFFLVNCYTPNSKRELERLEYREKWESDMKNYLTKLDKIKPVIYCGDLNVAHEEIDLKNPSSNHNSAGFTDTERNKMTELLSNNFVDSYRYKYPTKVEYSWWSYMFNSREKNIGWRIDYFITSKRIANKIEETKIHTDILGSDHCPIELDINI